VQELILHAKLDMGHGRALLALPAAKQIELANVIAAKGYSVRQAEHLVRAALAPPRKTTSRRDRDIEILETELSEQLGTRVAIEPRGGKGAGRVVIDYTSLDQLDVLVGKLR
jgi:ParB family chromosome partitioning protein